MRNPYDSKIKDQVHWETKVDFLESLKLSPTGKKKKTCYFDNNNWWKMTDSRHRPYRTVALHCGLIESCPSQFFLFCFISFWYILLLQINMLAIFYSSNLSILYIMVFYSAFIIFSNNQQVLGKNHLSKDSIYSKVRQSEVWDFSLSHHGNYN